MPLDSTLSEAEAAKLLRKIDLRVLPMLFIVYIAAFLDRANISNALTMEMPKELHLKGQQPNIALALFFVPYILFEVPSNAAMKKFSPHVWLSICCGGFGVVMIGQGFVKTYGQLICTRVLLGFFEAGIFPGSFYLISFWYKREEAQKRFTIYFTSVILASAFGGLLATGIAHMNGTQGYSNWRWIFILEGIVTMVVAFAAYFFISDFPSEAKWLTEAERQFIMAKNGEHVTGDEHRITGKDLATFFKEPTNYLGALMYFAVVVPIYSFAYFTPTIIKGLGYNVVQTQLHSVPPFAAAFGLCLVTAFFSDRLNMRLPFVIGTSLITIIGLAIMMTIHKGFSVRYLGVIFICMGIFSGAPIIICWYLMNLDGHKNRAIGSAFVISFGNTGGILAPFTFLTKYSPYYRTGYAICMGVTCMGVAATAVYSLLIINKNRSGRGLASEKHKLKL